MQFPYSRIIVFAKAPIAGTVKTRIIPDYGETFATELHCAMLWHILTVISRAKICPIELWCSPHEQHPFFAACVDTFGLSLQVQRGNNLGEKLQDAFDQVLTRSQNALVVGADCPSLKPDDFLQAFEALKNGVDVVLSPALDGGYVMLGTSVSLPPLFENISWGSEKVFEQTMQQIKSSQLTLRCLDMQRDVDDASDVKYLVTHINRLNLQRRLRTLLTSAVTSFTDED